MLWGDTKVNILKKKGRGQSHKLIDIAVGGTKEKRVGIPLQPHLYIQAMVPHCLAKNRYRV